MYYCACVLDWLVVLVIPVLHGPWHVIAPCWLRSCAHAHRHCWGSCRMRMHSLARCMCPSTCSCRPRQLGRRTCRWHVVETQMRARGDVSVSRAIWRTCRVCRWHVTTARFEDDGEGPG